MEFCWLDTPGGCPAGEAKEPEGPEFAWVGPAWAPGVVTIKARIGARRDQGPLPGCSGEPTLYEFGRSTTDGTLTRETPTGASGTIVRREER